VPPFSSSWILQTKVFSQTLYFWRGVTMAQVPRYHTLADLGFFLLSFRFLPLFSQLRTRLPHMGVGLPGRHLRPLSPLGAVNLIDCKTLCTKFTNPFPVNPFSCPSIQTPGCNPCSGLSIIFHPQTFGLLHSFLHAYLSRTKLLPDTAFYCCSEKCSR